MTVDVHYVSCSFCLTQESLSFLDFTYSNATGKGTTTFNLLLYLMKDIALNLALKKFGTHRWSIVHTDT